MLAQKAFSLFYAYPLIGRYLAGTTASGLFEARLAHEEMPGRENHVYSPAYTPAEMAELVAICDHISFNSLAQLEAHRPLWQGGRASVGLRVNPEHSTQEGHAIYDPCAPGSRLGIRRCDMPAQLPNGVEGLHFHNCASRTPRRLWRPSPHLSRRLGNICRSCAGSTLGAGTTSPGRGTTLPRSRA